MATEMLAITAPEYTDPSGYQLSTVPCPTVTDAKDVLVRVHAASINPVDVKKADGIFKMAVKETFPYLIGYDAAGVVIEVGKEVKNLKIGDEVYTRLPEAHRGAWSEYFKCPEHYLALKPKSLSFADAAALPLAGVTALQVLRQYKGSLEGKTVFVPGGLSGTGAFACQLAKNVFGAGKVITTVSTSKVPKVSQLLGKDVVDESKSQAIRYLCVLLILSIDLRSAVIDYTKDDPVDVIPARSVDFLFDTTGQAMQFLHLVVPTTGLIVSISTKPSATTLQASSVMQRPDNPRIPLVGRVYLNAGDMLRRLRAWRWSVGYMYWFLEPNGADLDTLRQFVEEGKLVPVVGARVDMRDIDKVREACGLVYKGKGGLGKTVFEVTQT
ncbi:hypothetical protein N7462_007397 [Penicillium macrosclerotiorum]|uniref:uncharacterized protein n=1 Tax=Penicillium macrosclerotiorum TaxID=303699 RepID=UPI0025480C22|nr:uncharacterized protein N7462_007397 [Penicillium macrosclerotiorum]KAJ5679153.1 hypothetical protein N7462_007397 [Penicillium macrosclerotiorum]